MSEETELYITKGRERDVRKLENLRETNDLTTGQVFATVANHFDKCSEDYSRWISFRKNRGEFDAINKIVIECNSDMGKINLICDWLGEQPIT